MRCWPLALLAFAAQAMAASQSACDLLVSPDALAAHSGHAWRLGSPIGIPGDSLACNYYQDDVPAGLSLTVREDEEKKDFANARETFSRTLKSAPGVPGEGFYHRHAATAPFEPSWGLVVHRDGRTYRLEGVPESDKPDEAQKLAREIVERAIDRFSKS